MKQNKLYVGNFPFTVEESQLRDIFAPYGDIEELAMIMDRDTGRPKGFAFITYAEQQAAEKAMQEQDGKDLDGRALKVNMAQDKPARGGRGGGGGGNGGRW